MFQWRHMNNDQTFLYSIYIVKKICFLIHNLRAVLKKICVCLVLERLPCACELLVIFNSFQAHTYAHKLTNFEIRHWK